MAVAKLMGVLVKDKFADVTCDKGHKTEKVVKRPDYYKDGEITCDTCNNVINDETESWRICTECRSDMCMSCVKAKHAGVLLEIENAKIVPTTFKDMKHFMVEQIDESKKEEIWTQALLDEQKPLYTFQTYYPAMMIPIL